MCVGSQCQHGLGAHSNGLSLHQRQQWLWPHTGEPLSAKGAVGGGSFCLKKGGQAWHPHPRARLIPVAVVCDGFFSWLFAEAEEYE